MSILKVSRKNLLTEKEIIQRWSVAYHQKFGYNMEASQEHAKNDWNYFCEATNERAIQVGKSLLRNLNMYSLITENKESKYILYMRLQKLSAQGYNWIARDGRWDADNNYIPQQGRLAAHKNIPIKHEVDIWNSENDVQPINDYSILFPMISWDNDKPTSISELLKMKIWDAI